MSHKLWWGMNVYVELKGACSAYTLPNEGSKGQMWGFRVVAFIHVDVWVGFQIQKWEFVLTLQGIIIVKGLVCFQHQGTEASGLGTPTS